MRVVRSHMLASVHSQNGKKEHQESDMSSLSSQVYCIEDVGLASAADANNNDENAAKKKCSKPLCLQHAYKECVFMCEECSVWFCTTCITTMKDGPRYKHMDTVDELDLSMKEVKDGAIAKSETLDGIMDDYVNSAKIC